MGRVGWRAREVLTVAANRGRVLLVAGAVTVLACSIGVLTPAAAQGADFTWTGAAPAANWSNGTNWFGGTSPAGSVGKLTFPSLTACSTCYLSNNDISNLTANQISIDDGVRYLISGNAITLGAGGITATTSSAGGSSALFTPITLGAPQTWSIDGAGNHSGLGVGAVTGAGDALEADLRNGAGLSLSSDTEVGPLNIVGSNSGFTGGGSSQNGSVTIGKSLNGSDGNPVNATYSQLYALGNKTIGPLTLTGSAIQVGQFAAPAGVLSINGGVTFDSASQLSMTIAQPGTAAGTDYSQISASGPVNLGGQLLLFSPSPCPSLKAGDVDTLITTTSTLSGIFAGVPDGQVVSLWDCGASPGPATSGPALRINYTPHSVTATVLSNSAPPTNIGPPRIWGTPVGMSLRPPMPLNVAHGTWTNSPTSFNDQWEDCDGSGNNCSPIAGAIGPTYALRASDVGHTLRVQETASNAYGTSAAATSTPTTPVAPAVAVLGKSFDAAPIAGIVFVKPPPGTHLATDVGAAAVAPAPGFVPLTGAQQIPAGSQIDTRRGTVQLTAAAKVGHGEFETGEFNGAIFKATQARSGRIKGLTTLSLLEGSVPGVPGYASCKHKAADTSGPPAQVTRFRRSTLRARGHGSFRTRGRYAAATVHGTIWDTTDRCDGTLITVHRGIVDVTDFRIHKTVRIHAGHSYLAKAKRR